MSDDTVLVEIEFYKGDPLTLPVPRDILPSWQSVLHKAKDKSFGFVVIHLGDTGCTVNIPCGNLKDFYPDGG